MTPDTIERWRREACIPASVPASRLELFAREVAEACASIADREGAGGLRHHEIGEAIRGEFGIS